MDADVEPPIDFVLEKFVVRAALESARRDPIRLKVILRTKDVDGFIFARESCIYVNASGEHTGDISTDVFRQYLPGYGCTVDGRFLSCGEPHWEEQGEMIAFEETFRPCDITRLPKSEEERLHGLIAEKAENLWGTPRAPTAD
jgi:hypothetical protein